MKENYIKLVVILSFVVVIIGTIFIKTNEYKESKKINIIIASTLSDEEDKILLEKLNKQFTNYNIIINKLSDGEIFGNYMYSGNIIVGLDEMFAIKTKLNYEIIDKMIPVVVKRKNITELNEFTQLQNKEYKNRIATTFFKKYSSPYVIMDYMYNKLGDEKAKEMFDKYYNNIDSYASNYNGVKNLLVKNKKDIGILPLNEAQEFVKNNKEFEIMKQDEYSFYNRTISYVKKEENKGIKTFNKESKEVYEYIINNELLNFEDYINEYNLVNSKTHNLEIFKNRIKEYIIT